MIRPRQIAARACLLLIAVAGAGGLARAAELPRAIIVVDGSGSMWTELGDSDRIKTMKSSLAKILPDYAGRIELGLVAFGHRKKGSCGDIERLLPPRSLDPAAFAASLDQVKPRGKAPIAATLAEATDMLAGPQGKSSGAIVLLIDGADNCKQDPCEQAAALASAHPELAIHVVGLSPSSNDFRQMQCVAGNARGTAVNARSGEELTMALTTLLDRIAVPPTPPESVAGPSAIRLSARLGANGPPLSEGLGWRIATLDASGKAGEEVYASDEAAPRVELPPGRYEVEATAGPAVARQTYEVKEQGTTAAELAIDAGILSVRALANNGVSELQNVYFTLSKTDATGATTDNVAIARDGFPRLVLRPGTYRIRVEHGLATVERSIVLESGREIREDVVLHVGRLALDARSSGDGAPIEEAVFRITEDDPAAQGGTREIARSAARSPVFTLPAGLYHVHVRLGAAETRQDVLVRADQETRETLTVTTATLSLTSRLQGAAEPLQERLSYRIERLDAAEGASKEVLSTSRPAPTVHLPAGRYLVMARYGTGNALERVEIELADGQTAKLVVEHKAGMLALSAHDGSGTPLRQVFWEILDAEGEPVWSTIEQSPLVPLLPGDYKLIAAIGTKEESREFTLAPGESKSIGILTE